METPENSAVLGLVQCQCGWVHVHVARGLGSSRHCIKCGAPASAETMQPTDGAGLPVGATLTNVEFPEVADADADEESAADARLAKSIMVGRGHYEVFGNLPDDADITLG